MALSQVVVFQQKRPAWPESTPPEFKSLAEECWQPNPTARPSFDSILDQLMRIRATIKERSKPLDAILARSTQSLGEDESESPLLGVSEHASIDFSMSDWTPQIVRYTEALPQIPPSALSIVHARPKVQSSPSAGFFITAAALPTNVLQLDDLQAAAANSINARGKRSERVDRYEPRKSFSVQIASVQAEALFILNSPQHSPRKSCSTMANVGRLSEDTSLPFRTAQNGLVSQNGLISASLLNNQEGKVDEEHFFDVLNHRQSSFARATVPTTTGDSTTLSSCILDETCRDESFHPVQPVSTTRFGLVKKKERDHDFKQNERHRLAQGEKKKKSFMARFMHLFKI